jgi:drug/metabolite transporter (DMT)-like permease
MWGSSAPLGKAAFNGMVAGRGGAALTPIDPLILAQARGTFAFLLLLPILLLVRGKRSLRMDWKGIAECVVMGVVGIAGSNFFYYYGIEKTSVATAIIIQYSAPVWVLAYMVMRGRQHATFFRVLAVSLAMLGSGFAIGALQFTRHSPLLEFAGLKWNVLGMVAALGAAFSFSFYNIYGQHLIILHDRWRVLLYALMGATIFWMMVNPPWKVAAAHYNGGQWMFLVFFSVVSILIPFSFYFTGLEYLDPTRAIVTSTLEPVFAIVVAAFVVTEIPTWSQGFGILLVLAGTIVIQIPEKQVSPVGSQ